MNGSQENRAAGGPPVAAAASMVESQIETAAEPGTNRRPARDTYDKSQRIARKLTSKAFDALAEVMGDTKAAATARVNAANTILEWGHGKRGVTPPGTQMIEKIVKMDWQDP